MCGHGVVNQKKENFFGDFGSFQLGAEQGSSVSPSNTNPRSFWLALKLQRVMLSHSCRSRKRSRIYCNRKMWYLYFGLLFAGFCQRSGKDLIRF